MPNRNAEKGKRWELAVVRFLAAVFGRDVFRARQEGFLDVGDINLSPFVLQAKDEGRHNFAGYIRDAEKQADLAGEDYGVAVVKRRQGSPALAYVAMTLKTFRRVVARLRRAEELLARHAPEVFHEEHLPAIKKDK